MLRELERVGDIVRTVRGGVIEAYQPGDVLACSDCGYTFVHRKAAGKLGSCRRCKSYQVTRWKPESG
jgi:predicted Zn-ribbon and HTH transcriptional regulator